MDFTTFLKSKGFIYPSSEIYGGLSGFYDYGHLGTKLKHNFQNLWREFFLSLHDNFHEIEAAQIMHQNVFKASGHLANFTDPITKTPSGKALRADHVIEAALKKRVEGFSPEELTKLIKEHDLKHPETGESLGAVEVMNLMFPMQVGTNQTAYLRPETAQSPFVNFKLQYELLRKKLPLGLAIIGKAFRNEISPRNLTLRLREFTQAELQIFFNPNKEYECDNHTFVTMLEEDRDSSPKERTTKDLLEKGYSKFYLHYLAQVQNFYLNILKIPKEKFRLYQLTGNEKAFYNKFHFDIEVQTKDHGWIEVGGLHYRTDHDLKGHQSISKQNLEVTDNDQKFIPHVLELSFGVDRNLYTLLDIAYDKSEERGNTILHLEKQLAPYQVAVFPLVKNKPELLKKAKEIHASLKNSFFDTGGSIGRRYARADEMGIKHCITVDFETLEDGQVTVRDRETTKQERVSIKDLKDFV